MNNEKNMEEQKNIIKILKIRATIFITIGIASRIFMLLFYYYTHSIDPQKSWGDIGNYFKGNLTSPPLTIILLEIFRFLSFGKIEIFIFWGFLWDLITCLIIYFVLKNFQIKNKNYVFGLFLINPFYFLTNSFSLENCGYHITDAFFLFFLLMAFMYYPKKENYAKYLFYIFLGLSMCTKYYTLPALGFFFIKYIYEKNWGELKIFLICMIPLLTIFLLLPLIYFKWFYQVIFNWSSFGSVPLYLRLIPISSIFLIYTLLRLKNADSFEISNVSIIAAASFMIFSFPYLRWFQTIIFYGILKEKEFFTFNLNLGFVRKEITVDNHLLTYILSIFGVFFAYIFILFVH